MKKLWSLFTSLWLTVVLAGAVCAVAAWGSLVTIGNPEFFSSLDRSLLFPSLVSGFSTDPGLVVWIWLLVFVIFLFALNTMVCTADKVYSVLRNKRPWRSLFPHIVHAGFLVALFGHLAGSIWGFRSPVNVLYMGETSPVARVEGLSVRLDDFDMALMPNGKPEYIKTTVTLFDDGNEVLTDAIEINGPLRYRGIAFYHMDQGSLPGGLVLGVEGRRVTVAFDESFEHGGRTFALGEIYPDFALDDGGRAYSRSTDFRNPFMEITSDGEAAYLGLNRTGSMVRLGGSTIELMDYMMTRYVILTINKDPGIGFIVAGSAILVLGMVLLLFFRGGRGEIVRGV